ncbi:MAG: hypothetical protein ABIE42_05625 [Candidatus Eisenbacteria bacterium]
MTLLFNQTHAWVLLLLGALTVISVIWFYRRVPTSAGRLRPLLVVLRSAGLVLLFVALVEPVLALSRTITERPVVALLLDASRSMSVRDGTGGERRGDEAVSLLNEVVLPRVARDADLVAFAFSGASRELTTDAGVLVDAPTFDGGATDLAQAFEALDDVLSGRNLGAVVVATDGADNRGAGPYVAAVSLGVPVFVLGVGSSQAATDIAIEDVVTNRISYTGESVPVEVTVSSAGFEGAETVVELSENGATLDSRQIELSGSGEEVRVTFRVTPSTPGVHRYSVSVPVAAGELSTANNSRIVVTTAMKGKIRVLVLAGRPGWDFAFLTRELEADRNVEVESVVAKRGSPVSATDGTPPQSRAELYEYDLVILFEPDWSEPLVSLEWLRAFAHDRGGGLLIAGIPRERPPNDVLGILPYSFVAEPLSGFRDVRVRLTDAGESAPATRVAEDRFANVEVWRELPPVRTFTSLPWSVRADADVLVEGYGPGGDGAAIVAGRRLGAGSVMAIMADGLWRWKMAGDDIDVYGRFVTNTARWLTARGELERVVVAADKDVYQAGEDIGLSAQVYRADYRLAHDAVVRVSAASGEGAAPVATVDLEAAGDHYRGSIGHLPPGPYVLRATASVGGEEVGTASGEFVVERFSLEDSETRRRSAILRRIAEESGGGYYMPETLDDLPDDVPLAWAERTAKSEFELWNSPWLLLGFVGLMSAEWALRRKQGLP